MGLLRKFRSSPVGTNLHHGSSDVLQSSTARVTVSYISSTDSLEENHIMNTTAVSTVSTEIDTVSPSKLIVVPEIRKLVPPLSPAEREALVADITEKGGLLVPVLIDQDFRILDGHNRTEIAIDLGLEEIPVTVVNVKDEDDAKRIAIEGNLNRRHLTLQARKKIANQLVKLTPWKSNRQLAKAAGLDPKTLGSIREGLESTGDVPPQDATVGADGKTRTTTRKPTKAAPNAESKAKEQFKLDVGALSSSVKELVGKLDRKSVAPLTAEAFVSAMTPAQKKAGWATEGMERLVEFYEEVLNLLDAEAEGKAATPAAEHAPEPF